MKIQSTTIYQQLQTQYKKLNNRIQSSKFYNYTQFKQQQLINRLNRCSLQLKHLGMGVGICVALGVGTPVMGQYVPPAFVKHDGAANPLEGLLDIAVSTSDEPPVFVDIDGDGDYDMFVAEYEYNSAYAPSFRKMVYYENIGTAITASYILRTGVANPLNAFTTIGQGLRFVDIDADGDSDLFLSGYGTNNVCVFLENTGTASMPNFVQQTGVNNPLDSVLTHLSSYTKPVFQVSFVDIDNDGDLDCFGLAGSYYSPPLSQVLYYENKGTVTNPAFYKQSVNPLTILENDPSSNAFFPRSRVDFYDMDKDGDKDVFFLYRQSTTASYFLNTGTATVPMFSTVGIQPPTPWDSIGTTNVGSAPCIVDIDGDGDLDVFSTRVNDLFFENLDTTIVSSIFSVEEESSFLIYPNPTTGKLTLERPVTGNAMLYNISGQEVFKVTLNNKQELDFSTLNNGVYFLYIETTKERIQKKVLVRT